MSPEIVPLQFDRPPAVLTIDLEEWFCVCGDDYFSDSRRWDGFEKRVEPIVDGILASLASGGHRATFFVLGWIARRYPELIRRAANAGHEIAFHGMSHVRCDELSEAELRLELSEGRKLLEDLAGRPVDGFRAAEWSIRTPADRALPVLAEEGFRYDASMTAIPPLGARENPREPFEIRFAAGGRIKEFPPLTGRAWGNAVHFGGGWAFRQLRWARVMNAAASSRRRGFPAIFTFHPWELDSDHPPMTGLSSLVRLTHFAYSGRAAERFSRLLAREPMSALGDLI